MTIFIINWKNFSYSCSDALMSVCEASKRRNTLKQHFIMTSSARRAIHHLLSLAVFLCTPHAPAGGGGHNHQRGADRPVGRLARGAPPCGVGVQWSLHDWFLSFPFLVWSPANLMLPIKPFMIAKWHQKLLNIMINLPARHWSLLKFVTQLSQTQCASVWSVWSVLIFIIYACFDCRKNIQVH